MAFNVLHTFQKNRRFWMAAILGICMVSFIFCTGMRGDMADRIQRMFGGGRGGATVASIDSRSISIFELNELKTQRNIADRMMLKCADMAFKKLAKELFEDQKKQLAQKDVAARQQQLTLLRNMQLNMGIKKSRPRYFEGGVKFDDLMEFKLWQAEADRLGIQLEDKHVMFMFKGEFFSHDERFPLSAQDFSAAQREIQGQFHTASNAVVFRAIREEFRVRIAQYALLSSQPFPYISQRRKEEGEWTYKFINPEMPDEIRAPMTLAQLWDLYKSQRAEFDVTLIPINVNAFIKDIKDVPSEGDRERYFNANKDKAADPSADERGLQMPMRIKLNYLMADPTRPEYLDLAKAIGPYNWQKATTFDGANAATLRKATDAIAFDPLQAPLSQAVRKMALAQQHRMELQGQYMNASMSKRNYRSAALLNESDFVTPIVARLSAERPTAIASLIGAQIFSPTSPLDTVGATAGYLAWGVKIHPKVKLEDLPDFAAAVEHLSGKAPAPKQVKLDKLAKPTLDKLAAEHKEYLENAFESEVRRRGPVYASVWGSAMTPSGMSPLPLDVIAPYLAMDPGSAEDVIVDGRPVIIDGRPVKRSVYYHPYLTLETVQPELEEMIANRTAEAWAQANMIKAKAALEKAEGDAAKYERALNELVAKLKLTYGPPEDKKNVYYNRYTVNDAKELEPLREAYQKYVHYINFFEGRDLTPERLLKPADFYKMFFESQEKFSATSPYRAMPWPPAVTPNTTRIWKDADPRLIDTKKIDPQEGANFRKHLQQFDPLTKPKDFDQLFKTASRPILFWRTAEGLPQRPETYASIDRDLEVADKDLTKNEENLKKFAAIAKEAADLKKGKATDKELERVTKEFKDLEKAVGGNADFLKKKQTEVREKQSDLNEIKELIVKGWKFERARTESLKKADTVANTVINSENALRVVETEGQALRGIIPLKKLSLMHPETSPNGLTTDYFAPSLPKDDQITFPRDDMMTQVLSLADLKEPIKVGNKDLDEINKKLFDIVKERYVNTTPKGRHVQILTNKGRSMFYIGAITSLPDPNKEKVNFAASLLSAPYALDFNTRVDLFAARAQQQQAKADRAKVIEYLRELHQYKLIDDKERLSFDERPGGD